MYFPRSDGRDVQEPSPNQPARKPPDDNSVPGDHTTLKYEGRMSVYDQETGGDPYNRTGRFRRVNR